MKKLLRFIPPIALILALLVPLMPTQVALAATCPGLSAISVSDITVSSARINYTLDSGGENCQVYIGYGHQGVSARGSSYVYGIYRNSPEPGWIDRWDFVIDVGSKGSGDFYEDISNLWQCDEGVNPIYYGIFVYNSAGSDEEHGSFDSEQDLAGSVLSYEAGQDGMTAIRSNAWGAQTFTTTGAIDVTMVSFKTAQGTGRTYTASIRDVDGGGKPTGADLGSASITPESGDWDGNWLEFWFSSSANLSATTQYAVLIRTNSLDSVDWFRDSDNGYANGRLYRSSNGTDWTMDEEAIANHDDYFRLYTRGKFSGTEYCGGWTDYLENTDITETTADLNGHLYYIGGINTTTTTQQNATVSFEYGTTTAYGSETTPEAISPSLPSVYTEQITGLTAGTTYHYRFTATNNVGEVNFANGTFTTRDISEEGIIAVSGALVTFPHQRNSFYAEGRHWLFNIVSNDDVAYETSPDGVVWTEPAVITEGVAEHSFAVTFDGVYFHLITSDRGEPLYYRVGKPNSNGSITWQAAQQEALPRNGTAEDDSLWTTCSITTDINGYPWIITGICEDPNNLKIVITSSTTKDGIWTTRSNFPTTAGDIFGAEWQRGILVPLSNGNMYAISGKRSNGDTWKSNKWEGSGGEKLHGSLWNGTSWGSVEEITTTNMAWSGDAASNPYILWSTVSSGTDIYLVFTNQVMTTSPDSAHNVKFIKRSWGTGWGTEETIQADVPERTAPILAINEADTSLYCFWGNSPNLHKVYYKKRTGSTWGASPTVWKFENLLQGSSPADAGLFSIQSWERATEGKIGIYYNVYQSTEISPQTTLATTNIHGGITAHDIRIAYMGTGFSVATDEPAEITSTTAILQGHLPDDGGEASAIRFQWGTSIPYENDTAWQSGKETGDVFNQLVSTFSPNTEYHYRAQAKHADETVVNGSDRTFTTTSAGVPAVTTGSATGETTSGATLQGTLTSLGDYSPVYASFEYGLTASYGSTTTDQTKTTTGGFNASVSGLASETTYHFRARVRYNSSYVYGSDKTFTTTGLGLLPPTNLIATRGDTTITLSWVKASGATNTMVRRAIDTYPTSISSGIQVYFGTDSGYTDNGLSNTQGYYYSAWSEYNGEYSASYATVYSPPEGTGIGVLPPPDTLNIWSVEIYESYFATGDQLICLMYNLSYSSGEPTQDVRDFFAIEVWDGSTLVARAPVLAWGERPGSVYLAPTNTLTWEQAFTLKVRGLASQWEIAPEAVYNVQTYNWTWSRDDFTDVLRTWCLSTANAVNSDWVNYIATGEALSDEACQIYNKAIPSLSAKVTDVCSSGSGFIEPEKRTHDPEYQRGLTLDNAGDQIKGLFDEGAAIFGMTGLNFGSMIFIILAVILMIAVGFFTRSTAFSLASATLVLGVGVWIGVVTLAWVMVVGGVLVLYMLYKLVVVGV